MWLYLPPTASTSFPSAQGGGGLDLGLELALPTARSVVMVEREAFAVAHLVAAIEQGLLAPAAIWSDVRTFDGRPWGGIVDGLIGGIPCQPHSLAGKKRGQLDGRDLWSDARRIIVQARPWFVLIENVGGMLAAGADEIAGAERVWRDLQKLGFAVEGGLFTAAEVGASHERERIFILAVADPGRDGCGAGNEWHLGSGRQGGRTLAAAPDIEVADAERNGRRQGIGRPEFRGRTAEPNAGSDSALADASRLGNHVEAGKPSARPGSWEREAGRHGRPVVDTAGNGRGQGWSEPILRRGRHSSAGTGEPMADAASEGLEGRRSRGSGPRQRPAVERSGGDVGHADIAEFRRQPPAGQFSFDERDAGAVGAYLFPPGPSDLSGWASVLAPAPEFEPAFRRVADGLASRLDIARVDRLRLLGNGVVCLEAAHAFRTLVARLASRGAAGAAQLLSMMGEAA